jgi:hypothetical protein
MVAAPQYATLIIQAGGSSINVDVYCSDVANALCNFDSGAGAGSSSETFFKSPVNGIITDFLIKTGMTDTTAGRFVINNSPTKSVIRWANQLNTLATRGKLAIPVAAGENIGIIQLA